MVNKDPSEIDDDALPELDEPVARDTHDNLLVGVYATTDEGVWTLQVRDWANRVVEATVYEKDCDSNDEDGGVTFQPLDTPEDMDDVAYLKEILQNRLEEIEAEEDGAQGGQTVES
ncbi:MAG: hypothetical protein SXQ77_04325 [Halobacteria archaeon]|nr:hypothetical protein [Halobacteria archaeon]